MASAIGPGDWVECVDAGPLRTRRGMIVGPSGLRQGGIYCVEKVGEIEACWRDAGEPEIVLREIKHPYGGGFCPDRFRPIYRPNASIIEALKQPLPDLVDA